MALGLLVGCDRSAPSAPLDVAVDAVASERSSSDVIESDSLDARLVDDALDASASDHTTPIDQAATMDALDDLGDVDAIRLDVERVDASRADVVIMRDVVEEYPSAVYATSEVLAARVFATSSATFVTARDGSFWGCGNNSTNVFQPSGFPTDRTDRRTRLQQISPHLEVREFYRYTPCVLAGAEDGGTVYCWGATARDSFASGPTFPDPWPLWQFPRAMGTAHDVLHLGYGTCTRSDHTQWLFGVVDERWHLIIRDEGHVIRSLDSGVNWLDNGVQERGQENLYDPEVQVLPGIVDAVSYEEHTCMLINTGRVMCWGLNNAGQCGSFDASGSCAYPGDGAGARRNCFRHPTEVPELTDVVKIAAGKWSTCALRRDGTVWCWGQNEALPDGLGVLGDGLPPSERCVPFEVVDGGRVEHPTAAMFCHKRPTQVPGITDAIDVSMGFNHACVVRATGQVLCWGANDGGQLGDGTTVSRGVPAPVRWY